MSRATETPRYDIAPVMQSLGLDVPETSGSRWKRCRCPYHEDRTASASVNQWGFRCHSCGRSGDAIKMIMTTLGEPFIDAKRRAEGAVDGEGSKPRRKRRLSSTLFNF